MTSPARTAERAAAVHERPWAVGAYLACSALVGLAWAAPLAAALGSITGAYPRGDAELFDPGGLMLLEALRKAALQLPAIGAAWAVVAVAALPAGLVALGFAIAMLGHPARPDGARPDGGLGDGARSDGGLGATRPHSARPTWALARAVRSVPTLVLIALVALIADAVAVGLVMVGGGAIVQSAWPEPPARDIARYGLLAAAALAVAAVGVLHDLARAAAVALPARTYASLRAALRAAARAPGRAAWAYAWRALLGLAAIVAAAWLGQRIGHRTTGTLLATAFIHQLALGAAGWLRLAWLAQAIGLVRAKEPLA